MAEATAPTNCDPRALAVARAVYEREKPLATILFGSRARGDYDDRRSDIDIMQVNPNEPDRAYKDSATEWIAEIAQAIYGRPVPVQLVWFAQDEFQENSRYVNHVTTQAMLDGVVMSQNPEDYRSRYANDEETEYEYQWMDYENRILHAELHLDMFESADDMGKHDLILGQQAHSTLEHAMKAVIAAHGGTYPATHNLGQLLGTVRRVERGADLGNFALSISPDIYSEYAGDQEYKLRRNFPTLIEQPDYRQRTVADAQRLIDRARAIRQSQS